MLISYAREADSSTWEMFDRDDKSSRTRWARTFRERSFAGPDTATFNTWFLMSSSRTDGSSASTGKVSMASTRLLISSRTQRESAFS